ncbi:PREDICTED: uncharacterized protein LOC105557132 [Vollenhovia emeryi]|uniref:uncharacterized protein LOC105557132 n=1 Tax=Vollenhovia emeryi TaxID=411798 RepID=UPI0005F55225|nr:PREDICTED: uncharacterized protein LOC105557132 [Vollenhovia emeryi]
MACYSVDQINKNPWLSIQDVVGDAKTWPQFIRTMFWDRNFVDHNRMVVVNFAIHVSEPFLHEVLEFTLKTAYTPDRRRQITDRFRYYNHEELGEMRRSRAYSYNVHCKCMFNLNFGPVDPSVRRRQ